MRECAATLREKKESCYEGYPKPTSSRKKHTRKIVQLLLTKKNEREREQLKSLIFNAIKNV